MYKKQKWMLGRKVQMKDLRLQTPRAFYGPEILIP
jgi:hypothetical protein